MRQRLQMIVGGTKNRYPFLLANSFVI